jgi:hypothetical protein
MVQRLLTSTRVRVSSFLLAVVACSDDPSQPSLPDVSGIYEVVSVAEVPTCDPASALEVLGPALGSGTFHLAFRIEQQGSQLTFTLLEIEDQNVEGQTPPTVRTIDEEGVVHFEGESSGQFSVPGAGTFFEQISSSATLQFDTAAEPTTFTSIGSATHVYRTESSTGPLFATCTQSETETGTRTST